MYIWNVKKLSEDLRGNLVTEKEKLKYTLVWVLSLILVTDPIFYMDMEYTLNDSILSLSLFVISALGITYCYKLNKSGDNKDFITRYVCLSIPIGIRAITLIIALIISVVIIEGIFEVYILGNPEEDYTTKAYEIIILSAFMAWVYYYLGKYILITSKTNA